MIRNTHAQQPARHGRRVLGQLRGDGRRARSSASSRTRTGAWRLRRRDLTHILMKVETHNHPTAIAPYPGAGTGSGGEIRDEGATGHGAQAQGGAHRLLGLEPAHPRRACSRGKATTASPDASPRRCEIMLDGPDRRRRVQQRVRPAQPRRLLPHVRACAIATGEVRGYHKPIMLAGGFGNISAAHTHEEARSAPARCSSSSAARASSSAWAAARPRRWRAGAERRVARLRLGAARQRRDRAPLPGGDRRLLADGRGQPDPLDPRRRRGRPVERVPRARALRAASARRFDLREIPNEEPGMSPMRDLVATRRRSATCSRSTAARLDDFARLCERERCPFAVVGEATRRPPARASTIRCFGNEPVDMPLEVLLGKPPRMHRDVQRAAARSCSRSTCAAIDAAATPRIACCACPTVADKTFLVTIGDRTVGGLMRARPDGRPVAGAGRPTAPSPRSDYKTYARRGDGDRRAHAARAASTARPRAAWRWARRSPTSPRRRSRRSRDVKLSANWMCARRPSRRGRDALRHRARRGHGALSRARHRDSRRQGLDVDAHDVERRETASDKAVTAPRLAHRLRVRAGRPTCARTLTPQLRARPRRDRAAAGRPRRRQATASAAPRSRRCTAQLGDAAPDLDDPAQLAAFFARSSAAERRPGSCSPTTTAPTAASSPRSCEMAFAGAAGVDVDLDTLAIDAQRRRRRHERQPTSSRRRR